jgi:hypothetical protein
MDNNEYQVIYKNQFLGLIYGIHDMEAKSKPLLWGSVVIHWSCLQFGHSFRMGTYHFLSCNKTTVQTNASSDKNLKKKQSMVKQSKKHSC